MPMRGEFTALARRKVMNDYSFGHPRLAPASAVGSQNQHALKHFGEFHIISITESLDGFRYLIESPGNAIHQPKNLMWTEH
jgi:hypothetical protein